MNEGYIQLHRKILSWEWFTDVNTRSIFIYCLLKANHTDKNWRGIEIKRGSFISSYNQMASDNGLSIRNVRTAIKKLEKTNEVTSQSTYQYTLFTVQNYDLYQTSDKRSDKRVTIDRQASDKRVTTTNNEKNDKNENNEIIIDILSFLNECCGTRFRFSSKKTRSLINARLKEGYSIDDFKTVIIKKSQEWINDEKMIKYLRPETLFGPKFEGYLNQPFKQKEEWTYGKDLLD